MQYSIDPKFDSALPLYIEAALLQKFLNETLSAYSLLYGTEGDLISEGFYSTWPYFAKTRVRTLNTGINALLEKARNARPRAVRETTMIKLWYQVKEMLKTSNPQLPPGPLKVKERWPGIFTTVE